MAIGNSISDEIKQQHKKILSQQGLKGKLQYFFSYYKLHALIAIFAIITIIYTIVSFAAQKDIILQVVYVNGFPSEDTESFMEDFSKTIEFDSKKQEIALDDSIYIASENRSTFDDQNEEKLFLMSSAGKIDVCIADETYFKEMAKQGYLLDLSTVLSQDKMEQYKDDLFYYDSRENMHVGKEAVGIRVTDAKKLVSTNSFPNTECYYCIIMNSTNIENALAFLDYIEK